MFSAMSEINPDDDDDDYTKAQTAMLSVSLRQS